MGAISDFIRHHYRHFNAAALVDAADGYVRHLGERRQDAGDARRRDEHRGARPLARRDDPARTRCTRSAAPARTSRRTSSTSSRTTTTCAIPHYRDLSPQDEETAARAAPEPRHRHLHPGGRGDAPDREARARGVGRAPTRQGERFFPHEFLYQILRSGVLEAALPDRPEGQLAARRRREEPADLRPRLGGLDARQHLRGALHRAAT